MRRASPHCGCWPGQTHITQASTILWLFARPGGRGVCMCAQQFMCGPCVVRPGGCGLHVCTACCLLRRHTLTMKVYVLQTEPWECKCSSMQLCMCAGVQMQLCVHMRVRLGFYVEIEGEPLCQHGAAQPASTPNSPVDLDAFSSCFCKLLFWMRAPGGRGRPACAVCAYLVVSDFAKPRPGCIGIVTLGLLCGVPCAVCHEDSCCSMW
eukprot:1158892-Pelagomonas_calceolata.AAC.26